MKKSKLKSFNISRHQRRGQTIQTKFSLKAYFKWFEFLVWIYSFDKSLSPYMRWFYELRKRILSLYEHNGSTYTVMYLKEAFRLMTKTLAGEHPVSLNEPRVATRRGLPLIIPGQLRLRIEARQPNIIKLTLTLLSSYRMMPASPKLKLETITDPFKGRYEKSPEIVSQVGNLKGFIPPKYRGECAQTIKFSSLSGINQIPTASELLPITSSGPNCKIACLSYMQDALALQANKKVYDAFLTVSRYFGESIGRMLEQDLSKMSWGFHLQKTLFHFQGSRLGRLALKYEAAGKVRVFAIVDAWTQSLLRPLHNFLFEILKNIEQDGTFDQRKPLDLLIQKNLPFLGSYDLSAATDRLPVKLQAQILSAMITPEFGEAWQTLLVDRPYNLKGKDYHYSVGQPMGALSSWAMLALTHHLIIQAAAHRAGFKTWFGDYAVLGDDVVIGSKEVSEAYLILMSDLGVDINLQKSVISTTNSLEFAKRTVVEGKDLSPIGPKLLLQCTNIPLTALQLLREEWQIESDPSELARRLLFNEFSKKNSYKGIYWDLVSIFSLNLRQDLSPLFLQEAIDSLSGGQRESLNNSINRVIENLTLKRMFKNLEEASYSYENIHRTFHYSNLVLFSSTQSVLSSFKRMLDEAGKKENYLSEDLEMWDELLFIWHKGFSLSDFLRGESTTRPKVSALQLQKMIFDDLDSNDPSLKALIINYSQAAWEQRNSLLGPSS